MSFFIGLFWWVAKMTDFFMGFVCPAEGEGLKFVVFWKTLINGGNGPNQQRREQLAMFWQRGIGAINLSLKSIKKRINNESFVGENILFGENWRKMWVLVKGQKGE
jgi:hypothetical protein